MLSIALDLSGDIVNYVIMIFNMIASGTLSSF